MPPASAACRRHTSPLRAQAQLAANCACIRPGPRRERSAACRALTPRRPALPARGFKVRGSLCHGTSTLYLYTFYPTARHRRSHRVQARAATVAETGRAPSPRKCISGTPATARSRVCGGSCMGGGAGSVRRGLVCVWDYGVSWMLGVSRLFHVDRHGSPFCWPKRLKINENSDNRGANEGH